jgi:hypothetical protein
VPLCPTSSRRLVSLSMFWTETGSPAADSLPAHQVLSSPAFAPLLNEFHSASAVHRRERPPARLLEAKQRHTIRRPALHESDHLAAPRHVCHVHSNAKSWLLVASSQRVAHWQVSVHCMRLAEVDVPARCHLEAHRRGQLARHVLGLERHGLNGPVVPWGRGLVRSCWLPIP